MTLRDAGNARTRQTAGSRAARESAVLFSPSADYAGRSNSPFLAPTRNATHSVRV
jgi:hypothetical protein